MFRFTIRDVLWLTVVMAMILGWWLDHRRLYPYYDFWRSYDPRLGGFGSSFADTKDKIIASQQEQIEFYKNLVETHTAEREEGEKVIGKEERSR